MRCPVASAQTDRNVFQPKLDREKTMMNALLKRNTTEKYLGERPESDEETEDDSDDTGSNVSRAGGAVTKDEMDGLKIPKVCCCRLRGDPL